MFNSKWITSHTVGVFGWLAISFLLASSIDLQGYSSLVPVRVKGIHFYLFSKISRLFKSNADNKILVCLQQTISATKSGLYRQTPIQSIDISPYPFKCLQSIINTFWLVCKSSILICHKWSYPLNVYFIVFYYYLIYYRLWIYFINEYSCRDSAL